ncbi:Alcohol dehydrogenase, class IV [Hathewaya proteolytica DSM 3090]|uniref:Alcohol dehydrogenase, class IV n=1 Tax=Hathewaya proteolytica DSM 3090 TaxID=1121331 RepID=A0A1M6KB30_9CLOT|nr:1-propanol dehydrogenase PduQ [Hathewaya proteolytica]SHJ56143.1 Alcohol dehydrogenase, class IV [Hathewaya proteolytica DSM 3090]
MNSFCMKPRVHFGENALDYLMTIKSKTALVVADPFMVKSGVVNKVLERLEKAGVKCIVFSDIVPDPPLAIIAKGIKVMDKVNPEVVVALGGGSAIDATKAIIYFRKTVKTGLHGNENMVEPEFIAIPTTSGTGSEVTSFSVITDREKNIKYPLVEEEMIPDVTILDPELVKSVPAQITADTGMDVLTHAIEAYVSTNSSDFSDAFAEKAIKTVFEYLPKAYKNGDDEVAREKMHNASCMAGMAFNSASLGINHSMAHILGGKFHIPHGRANAILLPYVIEYNANLNDSKADSKSTAELYANIAKMLGINNGNTKMAVKSLINTIKSFTKSMGIPRNIKELGINRDEYMGEVQALAEIALNDGCTATNPRKPELKELEKLFINIYNGI